MKLSWKLAAVAGVCLTLGGIAGAQLGSIIKGGAVAVIVDKFGPQINKAINGLSGVKGSTAASTRVVPILSVGDGGYMGAVQVSGPSGAVSRVQGVAQVEGRFNVIGGVRIKALIPVSTKTPNKGIKRVNGVGVSAIIDFKL